MHGAGNDFVVLDGLRQVIDMTPARARARRPSFRYRRGSSFGC